MIYILAYLYQLFSDYAVVFYAIWGVFNSTVLQALDSPTLIVHDRPFRLEGHLGDGTNKPDRALKIGYEHSLAEKAQVQIRIQALNACQALNDVFMKGLSSHVEL